MNIYNYDRKTKEYLSTRVADADPEATRRKGEFVPLIPANATLIAPPEYEENEIPVFENDKWVIKPDYRKNFYKVNDSLIVDNIKTIGEQENFYIVDKSIGEEIKQNPSKFKIEAGKVLKKSEEEYEAEQAEKERIAHITEIKTQLQLLDAEAVRPLRAILAGTQTDEDLEKIKEIETKVKELRINLNRLQ